MAFATHLLVNLATSSTPRDIVVQAWQLRDFISSGHQSSGLIDPTTRLVISHLTKDTFRPARSSSSATTRQQRARSRSSSLDPLAELQQTWPEDWAIDRTTVRLAVRSFEAATRDLRRLFEDPPSTGATPHNSPAATPLTEEPVATDSTSTSSNTGGFTTRATSAEEAIYSSPIGPVNMSPVIDPNMQAAINAAIAQYVAEHPPQPGQQGPPGEPGPPGPTMIGGGNGSKWNAGDLGFFDPMYDGKSVSNGSAIEHAGKETYFRDVHLFIERAKDLAIVKGANLIRENLWMSLRGTALEWWTAELSATERRITKFGDGVDEWDTLLAGRFKEPATIAIDAVLRERYTLRDASTRREPREYAQKILRSAKDAGMTLVKNQLDIIYNGIDLELRRDIKKPEGTTTVNSYLTSLDDCKHEWWAYASRHGGGKPSMGVSTQQANRQPRFESNRGNYGQSQFRQQGQQGTGFGQQPYGRQPNQPSQPYYAPQPFIPRQYGTNAYTNQQPQYPSRNLPQLDQRSSGNPPQQLQVTAGPSTSRSGSQQPQAGNPPQRLPIMPARLPYNNSRQPYQQPSQDNRPRYPQYPQQQRAYQANEDVGDSFDDEYDRSAGSFQYHAAEEPALAPDEELASPDENDYDNMHDVHFVNKKVDHTCSRCEACFPSRNKLFKHLRSSCSKQNPTQALPKVTLDKFAPTAHNAYVDIIKSTAEPHHNTRPGYNFRSWKYATLKVSFSPDPEAEESEVSPDTGCGITLGDRAYLLKYVPKLEIKKMTTSLPVRGVGNKIIRTNEYATVSIYVRGTLDGLARTACFTMEVHIVDDLKANILIGTDTMTPEGMLVDLNTKVLTLAKCQGLQAPLDVVARSNPHSKRTIRSKSATTIAPGTTVEVPVAYNGTIPVDRDFLFEPDCAQDLGPTGGVFAHIADATISMVQVHNATTAPVRLPKQAKLGALFEYEHDGAYMANTADAHLAIGNVRSWKKNLAKGLMVAAAAFALLPAISVTRTLPMPEPLPTSQPLTNSTGSTTSIDPQLEHVLDNGITVYGTPEVASQIAAVAKEFPEIWEDQGATVDIPEEEWMPIPLKPDAVAKPSRVYPVSQKDREVIDSTFDKLHAQGKMEWSSQPTPYSYPVFVVWKQLSDGSKKGRVVVDIRGLNKITESDAYPLPLQSDIIAAVAGAPYISTVDGNSYFHQFRVRHKDRHKLTVVSHRGQEQFNVALMGYKGSPPYVQRQTDRLLRPLRDFARAYVDDMITFSKTLSEHLEHLRKLFTLFRQRRVCLNPKKSFLGYPSVTLLGQRVDSLGLSTSEEKLAAIASLHFPISLRKLETFLGLTGWLRSSIPRYAQRVNALQIRKTELTKALPKESKGHARKQQSSTSCYDPTEAEVKAFKDLQEAFASPTFLVHYDSSRKLYIDLDASKEWGFAVMIYHVVNDPEGSFPRTDVQPIAFLSKMLNQAEQNYWPTELEVAGIVWVVKKVRHMIESTKKPPVVVYTDHSAAVPISRQTSLTTSSTDKLNLRLVRASQYLSMFDLTVRHKAGKANIVPDALSRLQASTIVAKDGPGVLEALYGQPIHNLEEPTLPSVLHAEVPVSYHITLVEMSADFKSRLIAEYAKDPQWSKVLEVIKGVAATIPNTLTNEPGVGNNDVGDATTRRVGLRFKLRDGLIYYTNFDDGRERLCIPNALEQEIFELAHDRQHHGGFHRTYDRIVNSLYLRHLTKHLRTYIDHCPECELNQTKRHKPYGSMVPIDRPAIPFHTIAMDFIVALPITTKDGLDCLLTITDKFSKRVLLVPGKTTYTASEWADLVLAALCQYGWGVPLAIISDRDAKFMSEFWKAVFTKLGTDLLASTAYHPQTDGQSERTNQTVEIAIRYYVTANPGSNGDWILLLPYLQGCLNNSKNQSTGVSPNEILYGFNVRDAFGFLSDLPPEHFNRLRLLKREQAEESLAFANAMAKAYYDKSHKPLNLAKGSTAYLRLHQGYEIPGTTNHKLHQQRVGPFKVLDKVGQLAYRLELPPVMKIHPVVSVVQLEPGKQQDPYGRQNTMPTPEVEEDGAVRDRYEIEVLLEKRMHYGKPQYLVKWKNCGNEHNVWYNVENLSEARELIEEYEARMLATPARPIGRRAVAQQQLAIMPSPPTQVPRRRGRPRKQPT